jgi:hypothetical protein
LPTLEGNGRPGAFLAAAFFAAAFLTGAFLAAAFFAAAFLAGAFFATFFANFFAGAFLTAFFAGAFFAEALFFAGTPRTLCAFSAKTNFATQAQPFFYLAGVHWPEIILRLAGVRLSPL